MEALAAIAKLMQPSNPRLEVQIISGARGDFFSVNNNNAMMLQRKEITVGFHSLQVGKFVNFGLIFMTRVELRQ